MEINRNKLIKDIIDKQIDNMDISELEQYVKDIKEDYYSDFSNEELESLAYGVDIDIEDYEER